MTDTTTKDLVNELRLLAEQHAFEERKRRDISPQEYDARMKATWEWRTADALERLEKECAAHQGNADTNYKKWAELNERLTASAPVDGDLREAVAIAHWLQDEAFNAGRFNTSVGDDKFQKLHKAAKIILALLPARTPDEPMGAEATANALRQVSENSRTPEPDADVVDRALDIFDALKPGYRTWLRVTIKQGGKFDETLQANHIAWAQFNILCAALAANLLRTPAGRPDREAVARTIYSISPQWGFIGSSWEEFSWEMADESVRLGHLKQADAVLALYPAAPSEAEAFARMLDVMKEQPPYKDHQMSKAALTIGARAIRRGRLLTDQEKIENLIAALEEPADLPPAPARGGEQVSHDGEGPAQSSVAAELSISPSVSGRGQPSPSSPSAEYVLELAEEAVKKVRPDLYDTFDSEIRATLRALNEVGMLTAAPRTAQGDPAIMQIADTLAYARKVVEKNKSHVGLVNDIDDALSNLSLISATSLSPQAGVDEERCPHCKASLDGGPIPENIRHHYAPPYRWSRAVGISDGEDVFAYECPDCHKQWPAGARPASKEAAE